MEDTIKEAAKQVPALIVLVLVMQAFLRQMSEARAEYLKAIDRFHNENMDARSASRQTIRENTEASDNQSRAINELTMEVRELRTTLSPIIRKMSES